MRPLVAFAVLVLTLSWDAPTLTCKGDPLTDLDHYEVPIFRVWILGWTVCGEVGATYSCPVYASSLTRESTPNTSLTVPDPGAGEVVGWEDVEAFDRTGNSSADCGGGA
jgi:hypothetical protein